MAKVSSSSLPAVEFDASSAVSSGQQLRDALSQQARCLLDSGTRRPYIRRPLLALHHVPCSPIAARPVPCTMSMSAPCLVRFSLSRRSFRPACCLLLAVPSARRVRSLTYCLLLAISNSWRARSLTARRATSVQAVRVIDLFREWDENGTGTVTKKEFRVAMPLLSLKGFPIKAPNHNPNPNH